MTKISQNVFAVSGRQLARWNSRYLTEKVRIAERHEDGDADAKGNDDRRRGAHWQSLDMNGVAGCGG
jgi:hypothetical protein